MKKFLMTLFVLVFFFVNQNALALDPESTTWTIWNTASNDCPTVAVANYTTNIGYVDPCWPLSSVSASPGHSVNIRIYYHNTSAQNATNVRVALNAPTINNQTNTHSFAGQITSDQGSLSFGPVFVNLSSPQKLSFGSTRWYQNQTQSHTGFLYGQSGIELIGNGLQIGTIGPGWSTQGSIVVSFYVNNPQPTGTLTPSSPSCLISAGQSSCLIPFSWNTINPIGTSTVVREGYMGNTTVATGNTGNNFPLSVSWNSSTFKLINNNTTLDTKTVTASCASGSTWNDYSMSCVAQNCQISNFTASPSQISPGNLVVLSWNTNHCNSVNISNVPNGNNLQANGSINVWPTNTTTYILTGIGGTSVTPTKSALVTVGSPVGAPGFPAGAPGYGP